MMQQHASVDVRFVLGQPDIVDGAGLGTGGLLGQTAFSQAHSLLLVRPMTPHCHEHTLPRSVWMMPSTPSSVLACHAS